MKDLLYRLCQYPFNPASSGILKELIEKVEDWDKAVALINQHGIIALSAYNIKCARLEGIIPDSAMMTLEKGYRQSVLRNIWLTERWKSVNKILGEAGIKHILLKGMVLEYTVYGGQGLRQMTDNDIFIRREESLNAWSLLQDHGFDSDMIKSPLYSKILTDIGKHLPSLRKDGYSVEIHHRLFYGKDADKLNSDVVDKASKIEIDGITAYVPPDDLHLRFLRDHLILHMLDGSFQMRLYADMELLKSGSAPPVESSFYLQPKRNPDLPEKRKLYRILLSHVSVKNRFRYITGDIFPSVSWLKKRHSCGTVKAILYYPRRIAKLFWLIGRNGNIQKKVEGLRG